MTRRRTRGVEATRRRARAPGVVWAIFVVLASQSGGAAKPEMAAEGPPRAPSATGAASGSAVGKSGGAKATAAETASAPIVYVPPSRGRARHTAGAGTRGPTQSPPRVAVLAPRDHVGLTASAHPRLYWHLAETTATRIELTVVDDEKVEPLLELSLPGPVHAGIHALDLGALGIALEAGKTYRWFVAVVHDPLRRSRDELAEGAIERIAATESGTSGGTDTSRRERTSSDLRADALARAKAGFWYDALARLEDAIEQDPTDAALRADRTALLAQGQLTLELP